MAPPQVLIDTAIALHADGSPHPLRDPCRAIVAAAGEGTIEAHASVELVQEYIHVARRHGNQMGKIEARVALLRRAFRLYPFTDELISPAIELLERHPGLEVRDAVHLATAIELGVETIISPDRHFEGTGGIKRVDPADPDALAALRGS